MDIVNRAKNICLTPNTEWPVIAAEPTPPATLITEYVVPLAAIGAVAGFIGGSIVGTGLGMFGSYRLPLVTGLTLAVFTFVMAIVGCFIISLIINALAPTFGGQKDSNQALKVAVYSYTPAWIAGVLQILPLLGGLIGIIAGLYGLYLLYLGLPKLMKCPQDKAVGYTVVVVICAIVVMVVVGSVGGMITAGTAMSTGMFGALSSRSSSSSRDVQFDKNSPLGKLQDLGAKLEESNKKMEAAQKSGDANAQAAAAIESLGTLLGGGKRVDPISIDELKPFVPDTFAGLPRRSINVEKTGMATIMVSKAEATYGDGAGKDVKLEITDTGGMSGMVGLVSWMGMSEEKDNEFSSERTRKVNGRYVHEKISKRGGENEFGIVLGERFIVGASGNIPPDQLRAGLDNLDLAKLEGMKGAGVQR
jgi:Yip1 domain